MDDPQFLRAAMIEAAEEQLKSNDPPQARQTLNRLMAAGHSRADAVQLIAGALLRESLAVMQSQESYNERRYLGYLDELE